MVKFYSFFSCLFLFYLVGCGSVGQIQTPAPIREYATSPFAGEKSEKLIYANIAEWQSTGVFVEKGDKLFIDARGVWNPTWGKNWLSSGDGKWGGASYLYSQWPISALIGRINEGQPFFVGAQKLVNITESGELFLRMNESNSFDNSGFLTVTFVRKTSEIEKISKTEPITAALPVNKKESTKLAVMDLSVTHDVDEGVAKTLSFVLRDEIQSQGIFEVLSKEDLEAIAERTYLQQQAGGCDDSDCLIAYGRALGTKYLLSGSISKLGETFIISLRLLDTEGDTAGVINRVNEQCKCPEEQLLGTIKKLATNIFQ